MSRSGRPLLSIIAALSEFSCCPLKTLHLYRDDFSHQNRKSFDFSVSRQLLLFVLYLQPNSTTLFVMQLFSADTDVTDVNL